MQELFEFIAEILFEFGAEASSNKKISKWIRYPLTWLIMAIYFSVIIMVIVLGIKLIKEEFLLSMILFSLALFLFVSIIFDIKKKYRKSKNEKTNE